MATPVLTKKQQKNTLAAKKNPKAKETIKNVLATPYKKYWPAINEEEHKKLLPILYRHLPIIKNVKVNIPWEELKGIAREDRKAFRHDYLKKYGYPDIAKNSDYIFGINDIAKAIERCSVAAVIITSDVNPPIMVHHVIDLCVLHSVPVILVKMLRKVLQGKCRMNSCCMAITKSFSDENTRIIFNHIFELSNKFPVPKEHINFDRREIIEISETPVQKKSEKRLNIEQNNNQIKEVVHLRRPNNRIRMFNPENSEVKENKMQVDDFIAFGNQSTSSMINNETDKASNGTDYKSLIVKRLKGDKNRKQRNLDRTKS